MKTSVMTMVLVLGATACGLTTSGLDETECELQDTRCNGDIVELCNIDADNPSANRTIWTEFDNCAENVDSGRTVCGSFDGTALCESPEENDEAPTG